MMATTLAVVLSPLACGRSSPETTDAKPLDAARVGVVSNPDPVPAGVSVCFPDRPASCSQTCRNATRVLWENCSYCHGDPATAIGLPPWGFVMDPQQLVTRSVNGTRYVAPGRPEDSLVYQRAVLRQDMPPVQVDPAQPLYLRVSAADGRILRIWITDCLGAGPVDAATDTAEAGPRG